MSELMERGLKRRRRGRTGGSAGGGKLVRVGGGEGHDVEFGSMADSLGGGSRGGGGIERVLGRREGKLGKRFSSWLVLRKFVL